LHPSIHSSIHPLIQEHNLVGLFTVATHCLDLQ
jgi:hypothetical protein